MMWISNSLRPTPCWCVNRPSETDVFPRLQDGCDRATAGVGGGVPARALFPDVLLQLLVGVFVADRGSFVESQQLPGTAAETGVLADAVAVHVDRGAGDAAFPAAGISAGVFSVVLCGQEKGSALPDGDHSLVGQLPGAGLCMEDDSRIRRRAQYAAAVCTPDPASPGIPALQSLHGRADAHAHLYA